MGGGAGVSAADFGDIFGDMFGDIFGGGRRGGQPRATRFDLPQHGVISEEATEKDRETK